MAGRARRRVAARRTPLRNGHRPAQATGEPATRTICLDHRDHHGNRVVQLLHPALPRRRAARDQAHRRADAGGVSRQHAGARRNGPLASALDSSRRARTARRAVVQTQRRAVRARVVSHPRREARSRTRSGTLRTVTWRWSERALESVRARSDAGGWCRRRPARSSATTGTCRRSRCTRYCTRRPYR